MSVHIPSLVGAPFTESSHTKQHIGNTVQKSLQAVDSSVVQNQVPMFQMNTTNEVPPSAQQTGIPLSMRGMPTQGLGLAGPPPSNMMAGQIPPKPLSAAPAPVQGRPGASMSTGKPGGAGSLVLKKEQLSIPIPKNSPVAGTLRIEIPYQNNKPLFKRIKDVIFVPSSSATPAAVAAPKPPMAVAAPKPPTAVAAPKPPTAVAASKPPPPVLPPRVFGTRKRVRKYKDGRVAVLSRGKAVTTYPDGRRVIMKRNRLGRMVTTTIKPNGVRTIQQGGRTVLIQPNGQRVITKRGPFGGVTVVTVKTDGTRIVQKGGKKVILKRRR
jgi:hypothetical protein